MWSGPWVSFSASSRARRLRDAGVVAGIALAHVGVIVALSRLSPELPVTPQPPPMEVVLVAPPVPPPPPPPPVPVQTGGGGAPAAPSRVHLPPPPVRPRPPEITAPPQPAPEPPLVIGVAPDATPAPGQGQGGQGTGTGDGQGAGAGSGQGGTPPRLVRGPSSADLRREHPPAAFRARQGGRGEVSCVIRADTTLEACRLVRETPPGYGFGEAALRAARYFRLQPPTRDGVTLAGERVTFGVEFGPPPRSGAR